MCEGPLFKYADHRPRKLGTAARHPSEPFRSRTAGRQLWVKVRPMLPLSPGQTPTRPVHRSIGIRFHIAEIRPVRAKFAAEQFQARIAPNNAMTLSRIDWR